jgi:CheY-like chemotaxis protein
LRHLKIKGFKLMATILIVDDEPSLREILSFFIESEGYDVVEAGDGLEAFEILQKQKIDLVLSDVKMPNCSGPDLLRRIDQEMAGEPKVILMTGYWSEPYDSDLVKLAVSIHTKPVDREKLFSDIRSVVGGKKVVGAS